MTVTALEFNVGLTAYDEEGQTLGKDEEASEIHVPSVHHVERSGLRQDLIKDVHIMDLAIRNADKRRDIAVKIQQRMHLDGGLALTESGPGEH